jgi:hypothetical protein
MSAEDRGSKSDEATTTLVGARPIKMLEAEQKRREEEAAGSAAPAAPAAPVSPRFFPEPPRTVEATGLSHSFLEDLCLKHLLAAGGLGSAELSKRAYLTPAVVEELMGRLLAARLVEAKGTRGVGAARTQTGYGLTGEGTGRAEQALATDRYAGPAPVALQAYRVAIAAQTVRSNRVDREALTGLLADLSFEDSLIEALGPAINGGRSLLLFGPAGNGKTSLCRRLARGFAGEIFVPRALLVEAEVITLFDEAVHERVEASEAEPPWDDRWVRCRRPAILLGADLTLADMELRAGAEGQGSEAPVQLKACGGVLAIDDIGRQRVEAAALRDRWSAPLDTGVDVLATPRGRRVRVPLDLFVVFSTGLDLGAFADEAFLRRVACKVEVRRPDASRYVHIFRAECERRGLGIDAKAIDHLVSHHYQSAKRRMNACEPRDLLDLVADVCAYRGVEPAVTRELIERAAASYFVASK